jgi:hypothetical protein
MVTSINRQIADHPVGLSAGEGHNQGAVSAERADVRRTHAVQGRMKPGSALRNALFYNSIIA